MQVAVVHIVAVKEAAFLLPVHGIIRRIQIEHGLGRGRRVRLHEELDEQPVHRLVIDRDPFVALRRVDGRRRQFQAIERTLAGERLANVSRSATRRSGGIRMPGQHREQRTRA